MNFEQEFRLAFGEKYGDLRLKEVVVSKRSGVCTITFLYPSNVPELSAAEKKEIITWIKEFLNLEGLDLKVKMLRVFVEEKLIMKEILKFFDEKHKLAATYLDEKSFKIEITPIDVLVDIVVSPRLETYFQEHKVVMQLSKHLKENFLVEFVVNVKVDENFNDEVDIDNVEIRTAYRPIKRYSVQIINEVIGRDILNKPEYIAFITSPKESVVVAGFVGKIERKDFIRKSGAKAGEQGTYYSFTIEDEKGKIDCIYFCPKSKIKVMDSIEEYMYLLLHGDVQKSKISDKLVLRVDKIALASKEIDVEEPEPVYESKNPSGNVVEIEKLTTLSQDNFFGDGVQYNDTINGKNYVVFDIETTGLDTNADEIIELGAVKIENGQIKEKFSTFVKPNKLIPFEVTELTGITNEMVQDAPPANMVLEEFYNFTRDCILCGHNIIGFDILFVKRIARECGIDFDNEIFDTLNLARRSHLSVGNFKLGTIVKALGLTLEGAHRAWNDAYATAEVLLKLCEKK